MAYRRVESVARDLEYTAREIAGIIEDYPWQSPAASANVCILCSTMYTSSLYIARPLDMEIYASL